MLSLAWKILRTQRAHLFVTAGGVSVAAALMILLLGVYEGVKEGATAYLATSPADLWISQNNSTNLLRSSSLLRARVAGEIANVQGVKSVGIILRVLTKATVGGETVILFLLGVRPADDMAYPGPLLEQPVKLKRGELIVDRAFATKYRVKPGDSVIIQGGIYRVAGFTSRTNTIIAQLTFCTLEDAQGMLAIPGLASILPARIEQGADPRQVIERIEERFPGLVAYTKEEFLGNTVRDLETGLLPVLWSIALLGVIVGAAVIALLLYSSVIDHREDYALLKALGAGRWTVTMVVLLQALIAASSGAAIGLVAAACLSPALAHLIPEVSLNVRPGWILWVFCACVAMALGGAGAPMRKLTKIDPEEVFRS